MSNNSSRANLTKTSPAPQDLLFLQMRVLQSILREAEPALAELGLDMKGFFLLSFVEEHPGPAALASALMLPKPTTTHLIKRAESAGHICRNSVPGDLRRFRLTLTPAGRGAVVAGQGVIDEVVSRRFRSLTASDRRSLSALLAALLPDAGA